MITRQSLTHIGSIFKPHGIKGELSVTIDYDVLPEDLRCLIIDIDGIYVPFFIESSRARGSESFLIKFDGINDEKSASALSHHEIFALTEELPFDEDEDGDGVHLFDLEGYELHTDEGYLVGVIEEIDDSTSNILFHVKDEDDAIIYVPFAEEFITALDTENKIIEMALPEGLVDLNN